MPDIIKLISELENTLYSSDIDIIECLKKARVVAKYYNDIEIIQWIEKSYLIFTLKIIAILLIVLTLLVLVIKLIYIRIFQPHLIHV